MEKPQALPLQRRPATNQRHALPPKRRGEIAELAFMQKAVSLGFAVAKPWGDSERYDYILDAGGRFWRVQVRSTAYESHRGYAVHTYIYLKRKMVALTADDIDCIVAYIVPDAPPRGVRRGGVFGRLKKPRLPSLLRNGGPEVKKAMSRDSGHRFLF
jgi:hypothetical protein